MVDVGADISSSQSRLPVTVYTRVPPGIHMTNPEATYPAQLDCIDLISDDRIQGSHMSLLMKAKIALSDAAIFGPGGEGFVRLDFGCTQSTLIDALERMKRALHRR